MLEAWLELHNQLTLQLGIKFHCPDLYPHVLTAGPCFKVNKTCCLHVIMCVGFQLTKQL